MDLRGHRWEGPPPISEVIARLREGEPSIEVAPSSGDELIVSVWTLEPGEVEVVARRLREILATTA